MLEYKNTDLDVSRFPDLAIFQEVWDDMRGERFAPCWGDFDLLAFPPKMIPNIYIVDVIRNPLDFRYRFVGTGLVNVEGRDFTGLSVDDTPLDGNEKAVRAQFERFIKNPDPVFFATSEPLIKDRTLVLYCGLRLPISDDGESVDKIACLTHFMPNTSESRDYIASLPALETEAVHRVTP